MALPANSSVSKWKFSPMMDIFKAYAAQEEWV